MNGPVIAFCFLFFPFCFIPVVWRLFAWFLLFHLSYYNISHRIATLSSFIEQSLSSLNLNLGQSTNSKSFRIKTFKTCGYIFDQICLAANNINSVFSLSMLIIFTILMALSTTSIFFFIYSMSSLEIPFLIKINFVSFISVFMLCNVMMLIILLSAESPIREVFKITFSLD